MATVHHARRLEGFQGLCPFGVMPLVLGGDDLVGALI